MMYIHTGTYGWEKKGHQWAFPPVLNEHVNYPRLGERLFFNDGISFSGCRDYNFLSPLKRLPFISFMWSHIIGKWMATSMSRSTQIHPTNSNYTFWKSLLFRSSRSRLWNHLGTGTMALTSEQNHVICNESRHTQIVDRQRQAIGF